MNYTDLTSTIISYVENTGSAFAAQIPTFLRQAEQRVYNTVQFPIQKHNVTGALTLGSPYLSCPSDFLAAYSLAVISALGDYTFLLNKDSSFIRQAYTSPTATGTPRYYALFGAQSSDEDATAFIVGPTPNAAYTTELQYLRYPESIVDADDGRTWLGDNFDSVLLYGALVEAYTWLKGEADMVALYDGKYKEALAMAKRLGDGLDRQDAYRSGQYRQPVN